MSAVDIILPKTNYAVGDTVQGQIRVDKALLLKAKTIEFAVRGFTRIKVKTHVHHRHGSSRYRWTSTSVRYVDRDTAFFEKSLASFLPKVEKTSDKKESDSLLFKNPFTLKPFEMKNPFEIKNPFESKPDQPTEFLNCAFEFTIPQTAKNSTDNYPQVKYEISFLADISFLKGEDVKVEFTVINPNEPVVPQDSVEAKCFHCNKMIQIKNPKKIKGTVLCVEGTCPECNSHVERYVG